MSIRRTYVRAFAPAAAVVVIFTTAVFLFIVPQVERVMRSDRRERVRELVDVVHGTLTHIQRRGEQRGVPDADTKRAAAAYIAGLRYGPEGKDYFWANDLRPFMIVHPYRPDLDGTDLSDFQDHRGKRLFVEMVRVVNESGAGWVDYHWQWKDVRGQEVPKLSYVRLFEPWGWVIGTGMYLEDVSQEISRLTGRVALVSLLILLLVGVVMFSLARQRVSSERERRRAEAESRERGVRLRALYDQTFHLVGTLTPRGDVEELNHSALELAGRGLDELQGRPLWEMPWWRGSEETRQQIREAVADVALGEFVRLETTAVGVNDERLHYDFSLKGVQDEYGEDVLILVEGRDITARVRSDEDRRQLEHMLSHSQKMEALGRLAGGIAHDFNNLLTAILGNAELLRDDVKAIPGCERQLLQIRHAGRRAADLVQELLAFARPKARKDELLDLHAVLERAGRLLRGVARKNIDIDVQLAAVHSTIRGDANPIENAVMNLGINACDAMGDVGRLRIQTRDVFLSEEDCAEQSFEMMPGPHIEVRISDTGSGMDAETQARIFEPFFTTKAPGKGTGLGLASVYGTATSHKGSITVQSRPGEGTVFVLTLPVLEDEKVPHALIDSGETRISGTGRVLVVDDEETVLEFVQSCLASVGYSVSAFRDGRAAVELFEQDGHGIGLVLLDMVMPGMTGPEVFTALRTLDPDVPIVMASGFCRDDEVAELKAKGAVDFLSKPFRVAELSAVVARWIRDVH